MLPNPLGPGAGSSGHFYGLYSARSLTRSTKSRADRDSGLDDLAGDILGDVAMSLSQTKCRRIGDAIRQELGQAVCGRLVRWHVMPASPCPKIGVYESDCSNRHKREADGEDAARQTPGYGQGIPVESIRSASHNS